MLNSNHVTPRRSVVASFSQNYRIRRKARLPRKIGVELEFPVVNDNGEAVDYATVHGMFTWLKDQGWTILVDSGTGEPVAAEKAVGAGSGRFGYAKDVIGTDVGYCTVETSLTPEDNLFSLNDHWLRVKGILLDYFGPRNCRVLGYGIQPLSHPHRKFMANKGRYVFFEQDSLNRFLDQRDGCDLHIHALSAANQCHIDVFYEEAVAAVNLLNSLSPLFTAISANSSVWKGEVDAEWLDVREIFWDWVWSNRLEQIGVPEPFADFRDYVDRLCSFRPLMVKRGDEYIKIIGVQHFGEYLRKSKCAGQKVDGGTAVIQTSRRDILFQGGFAWWNARLSPSNGTVEIRPCSQQPESSIMSIAALSLGLIENLAEAQKISGQFTVSEWRTLRFDALRHGLRATICGESVIPLVSQALQVARAGLLKRGLGEEAFLVPLEQRLENRKTIADEVRSAFDRSDLSKFFDLVEIRR